MHNYYKIILFGLVIILSIEIVEGEKYEGAVPQKLSNGSYILRYTEEAQFLPNLISLYADSQVYLDIVKNTNGDIIIEFISSSQGSARKFFGLKSSGRYLYGDEKIMSSTESYISINDDDHSGSNIVSFFAKDENNNEYMISSVNAQNSYLEIYDFEAKTKSLEIYKDIFNLEKKNEGMFTVIEIEENNKYYAIICGNFYVDEDETYFKLMKINIKNKRINLISNSTDIKLNNNYNLYCQGCYATDEDKIICFIYSRNLGAAFIGEIGFFTAYIFNYQLEKEKNIELKLNNFNSNLFKCIHIKNNICSIIFLKVKNIFYYLNLKFLNYQGGEFVDYLPENEYQIDYNEFDYQTNNFIKISDNKICFIAQTTSYINIYLIYLYEKEEVNSNKVVIREYNINTNSIYNINKYQKISSVIYNNFIALVLNYNLPENDYQIHSGLIIFGYANSTDYELDLEEYIYNENNLNVEIDLKSFLKIENNVFGYEYNRSIIIDLNNCNGLQLYSSKDTDKEIKKDSNLGIDEAIKFDLKLKDYYPFECIIEYRIIVSEPDIETFNKYPNKIKDLKHILVLKKENI